MNILETITSVVAIGISCWSCALSYIALARADEALRKVDKAMEIKIADGSYLVVEKRYAK